LLPRSSVAQALRNRGGEAGPSGAAGGGGIQALGEEAAGMAVEVRPFLTRHALGLSVLCRQACDHHQRVWPFTTSRQRCGGQPMNPPPRGWTRSSTTSLPQPSAIAS
jgi:hypothetical protein